MKILYAIMTAYTLYCLWGIFRLNGSPLCWVGLHKVKELGKGYLGCERCEAIGREEIE